MACHLSLSLSLSGRVYENSRIGTNNTVIMTIADANFVHAFRRSWFQSYWFWQQLRLATRLAKRLSYYYFFFRFRRRAAVSLRNSIILHPVLFFFDRPFNRSRYGAQAGKKRPSMCLFLSTLPNGPDHVAPRSPYERRDNGGADGASSCHHYRRSRHRYVPTEIIDAAPEPGRQNPATRGVRASIRLDHGGLPDGVWNPMGTGSQ